MPLEPSRPFTLRDSFRLSDEVVFREVGGEAVILDLKSGTYFGLDPVGTRIWHMLSGGVSVEQVVTAIVAEYDVARTTAETDVLDLVSDLCRRQLIHPQA